MADDKDDAIPDPWAGLEAEGESEGQDEFAFSFEGLDVEAGDAAGAVAGDDVAAGDGDEPRDESASVIEASVVEAAEDRGFESLEVEAVVEDDIAGWLNESAAAVPAADSDAETEFVAAIFAEPAADDAMEEPQAAVDEMPETEEVVETLFMSDEAAAEVEPVAVVAVGGAAVAAAAPSAKAKAKKKSGGGAIGPIIGGLLSLPIVFLILLGILWGTGRDPIGMRSWLPSFMLPARQGGRAVAAAAATDTAASSLDDLASQDPATGAANEGQEEEAAAIGPDAVDTAAADPVLPAPDIAIDPVAMVNETSASVGEPPLVDPVEAARPKTPSLDFSGIEAAVEAALASMDIVSADQPGDPAERRRALVAWYKDLARVGAEFAILETTAADSGRPLEETPVSVMTLYGRLGSAGALTPDLKRLCRNWVDYAKRPADGVLLVGVLEVARQVGPFWYSTLSLELVDGSLRPVSVISRRAPRADPGDRVAVAGVVFSEDTVWAADCGRLDAAAAPAEEDPF